MRKKLLLFFMATSMVLSPIKAVSAEPNDTKTESTAEETPTPTPTLDPKEEQTKKDQAAAEKIDKLIAELPGVDAITLSDAEKIASARAALDALTDEQRELVRDAAVLAEREERLAALQKADADEKAAAPVQEVIDALPDPEAITLENADGLVAARTALSELTEEQQTLVEEGRLGSKIRSDADRLCCKERHSAPHLAALAGGEPQRTNLCAADACEGAG